MNDPITRSHVLRFGVFEADGRSRELRKQGARVRLQEQPFQVLWLLLQRAGDVVTRDELRQRLWPSSVYVDFDHGLNNAIARVRDALGDTAGAPRFIETLPRLGYRFVYPVEAVQSEAPAEPPQADPPPPAPRRSLLFATAAALVGSLLLAGWWFTRDQANAVQPATAGPSIAVLPFVNMSDDMEREHFADGLSEELLNKLAGIQGLKVAGRLSSFRFKGKDVPAQAVASALKVNHLLEGSVRHAGSRVRVTTQLIEARNGFHVWSQTYDRELTDIFRVQEDIAMDVASALKIQLLDADVARIRKRGTHDAEAHRLYLMALTELRGHGRREPARARQLFEAAISRDPRFADAHAGLALFYFRDAWVSLNALEESVRLGRAAAERALALDPHSSEPLIARANFDAWQWRFRGDSAALARAQRDYRRAMELDPTSAPVFFNYARAVEWDAPDLSLQLFEQTADLDPLFAQAQGRAAGRLDQRGQHDAARKRLRDLDAQPLMSGEPVFAMYRGVQEMRLGRMDEALPVLPPLPSMEFDLLRWSMYMSLGDRVAARKALATPRSPLAQVLYQAALLSGEGRSDAAFALLERNRDEFPESRVLDLPAARLALIIGNDAQAVKILKARLPDLVRGVGPVTARNVMPALDLVRAYARTGDQAASNELRRRVEAFFDGPDVPWQPMFAYVRARAHVLANEHEPALQALDRAYQGGFRKIWAMDLTPEPIHYVDSIDTDPVFEPLRADARFRNWRERIRSDNARQLEALRARLAAEP